MVNWFGGVARGIGSVGYVMWVRLILFGSLG